MLVLDGCPQHDAHGTRKGRARRGGSGGIAETHIRTTQSKTYDRPSSLENGSRLIGLEICGRAVCLGWNCGERIEEICGR